MTMTPEIESLLEKLTSICCDALERDGSLDQKQIGPLVESLSANGWKRHSQDTAPLSVTLKKRVKEQCAEPSMHRGAALDAVVAKVQDAYEQTAALKVNAPGDQNETQASAPRTTA